MRSQRFRLGCIATTAFAAAAVYGAGALPPTELVGGLACFASAGDGSDALALAKTPGWIVQALDNDPANVAALRERAAAAGVLGRTLYVDRCPPDALPLADHLADWLVASPATPEAEVLRVLAPVRGRAIIGDKALTKPALPGADDWMHRLHGPDNNPVSSDTAFKTPARLQYLAMPMQTSFQGSLLVANGRRIELSDWVSKNPNRDTVAGKLLARSLYNGQILWERALSKQIESDEPIVALAGDRIYLAADDACRVQVLDAETGRELPALTLGDGPLRVKWLGIEQDRLYALVGAPLPARPALSFVTSNRDIRAKRAAAGHTIVALDLQTNRELWRHDESVTIDFRTIAVRDGRTYFYGEQTRLACLDAAGKLVWENKEAAKLTRPPSIRNVNVESTPTLIVGPAGQLRLSVPGGQDGMLFNTADGKLLWQDKRRDPKGFFVGDRYYTPKTFYEAATGKELGESGMEGGGCGIATWVPAMEKGLGHVAFGFKSPCGVGAFVAGGVLVHTASQCDCWPHLRGAAGLVAASELKPAHPLETGNAPAPKLAAAAGDWPLYRGDARRTGNASIAAGGAAQVQWVARPEPLLPVPEGHDRQRLEWLDRPTPPVTAGGLAFCGASDGAVRAVRCADGKPSWTFWTGGAVLTAPAVAGGRVYAGSADGWLYSLDAATGQLAWRWRGAPADQRIMIYGKLMSSWPVTAVLADAGTVYGVAGQWMQNGVVTFALDAATGRERWTHWTEPSGDPLNYLQRENFGFSPAGELALVGQRLWVRTYLGVPAIFETATGQRVPTAPDLVALQKKQYWTFGIKFSTSGRDIVVVDDRFVLQGGVPLLSNPDLRGDKSAGRFIGYHVNDQGQVPGAGNPTWGIPSSLIAPALGGGDMAIVGGVGKSHRSDNATIGLSLWAVDTWRSQIEALANRSGDAGDDEAADPIAPKAKNRDTVKERAGDFPALDRQAARWQAAADVNAVVLASDAVLAAVGEPKSQDKPRYGETSEFTGWKLKAFDRATGKEQWSVGLPGEPVFNGIAPAADGSWVVVLRDGTLVGVRAGKE
jgi:outer membrane protein assembly factor BamB